MVNILSSNGVGCARRRRGAEFFSRQKHITPHALLPFFHSQTEVNPPTTLMRSFILIFPDDVVGCSTALLLLWDAASSLVASVMYKSKYNFELRRDT